MAAAAKILEIEPLLERRPGQLSGGQRQRVAIGRAIVRKPDVFLFDEPLSNLDAELRVSMRIEIARLHRELGNTMVYVTHDQTEAMTLADKIVVLRDGRIEQVGTPRDLYEDPANRFVAGFIGSPKMNFLAADLDGKGAVRVAGIDLPIAVQSRQSQEVILGVRPEHLTLGEPGALALAAAVEFSEYLGGTRFLYCRLDDGQTLVVEQRSHHTFAAGQRVHLHCPADTLRLFTPAGARIR